MGWLLSLPGLCCSSVQTLLMAHAVPIICYSSSLVQLPWFARRANGPLLGTILGTICCTSSPRLRTLLLVSSSEEYLIEVPSQTTGHQSLFCWWWWWWWCCLLAAPTAAPSGVCDDYTIAHGSTEPSRHVGPDGSWRYLREIIR